MVAILLNPAVLWISDAKKSDVFFAVYKSVAEIISAGVWQECYFEMVGFDNDLVAA